MKVLFDVNVVKDVVAKLDAFEVETIKNGVTGKSRWLSCGALSLFLWPAFTPLLFNPSGLAYQLVGLGYLMEAVGGIGFCLCVGIGHAVGVVLHGQSAVGSFYLGIGGRG